MALVADSICVNGGGLLAGDGLRGAGGLAIEPRQRSQPTIPARSPPRDDRMAAAGDRG